MKIDINIINQIINSKNKNCKNINIDYKNKHKHYKISNKYLCVTNIDRDFSNIKQNDLFPFLLIEKNINQINLLSKLVSQKINSSLVLYRSIGKFSIIERLAKESIYQCLKNNNYNIEFFIDEVVGFDNIYKKELKILPYVLTANCLSVLYKIYQKLESFYAEVAIGASQNYFSKIKKYSNARIYGIMKYNENMVKFTTISQINFKKCIFIFINKLNIYNKKIKLIFQMLNNLIPYLRTNIISFAS